MSDIEGIGLSELEIERLEAQLTAITEERNELVEDVDCATQAARTFEAQLKASEAECARMRKMLEEAVEEGDLWCEGCGKYLSSKLCGACETSLEENTKEIEL